MANVLPSQEKQKMVRGFYARAISVGAIALLLGAAVASLSLVPTLISIRIAAAAIERAESELSAQVRDDQAKHGRAQSIVTALLPIASATSSPFETAVIALQEKPTGLSITSVTYGKGQIQLGGVATNRDAVSIFRDALEKTGHFKTVSVPVAALVGTQQGRFTITLSGDF